MYFISALQSGQWMLRHFFLWREGYNYLLFFHVLVRVHKLLENNRFFRWIYLLAVLHQIVSNLHLVLHLSYQHSIIVAYTIIIPLIPWLPYFYIIYRYKRFMCFFWQDFVYSRKCAIEPISFFFHNNFSIYFIISINWNRFIGI